MAIRIAPSLRPLEHLLVSKRHLRAAKRWPWAWWCTECDDGYGAAETEEAARAAGTAHENLCHHLAEGSDR